MEFWKMHGAGNDFIIVDNRENRFGGSSAEKAERARTLCNRHFGIGADGMMFAEKSSVSGIKMSFYNSDGSEAAMCGNGIRCFAKYVYDKGIFSDTSFAVETGDGIRQVEIIDSKQDQSIVKVDMGIWDNKLIEFDLHVIDRVFTMAFLHIGVPHVVCFLEKNHDSRGLALEELINKYGPVIEKDPTFKDGTNVNFVTILGTRTLEVSTWERGAGRTLACGTGACASVIAAHKLKGLESSVYAEMPGGTVLISIQADDKIVMEGPAKLICKGTF